MSRGLQEFDELQQVYIAIRDVDAVINGESKTKLEDAWNVISSINKEKFDEGNVSIILETIRACLVQIYRDRQDELNQSIGLDVNSESAIDLAKTCKRI